MAESTTDGGPAFPHSYANGQYTTDGGMTLLDYFAGQALAAIVAQHRLNSCGDFVAGDGLLQHYKAPQFAAKTAYQFAAAMIAEREEQAITAATAPGEGMGAAVSLTVKGM